MNSKNTLIILSAVIALHGCDRKGTDYLPQATGDYPSVLDIGTMGIMTQDQFELFRQMRFEGQAPSSGLASDDETPIVSPLEWCRDPENRDANGNPLCYFGQLSGSVSGVRGGATYTFSVPRASDSSDQITEVCVIVDAEAVYWNQSISPTEREEAFAFPDFPNDDGDLDLFVGMTSYYTGSPGVELGDFKGFYTDSRGRQLEIEYGECQQNGSRLGFINAHAGRGSVEACPIEVGNRADVPFTVVLDTFSVPLDDGVLSFGTLVVEGDCRGIIDECTVRGEALVASASGTEPAPGESPAYEVRTCTPELEEAVCIGVQRDFCCLHPSMCWDELAPDDACDLFFAEWDPNKDGRARQRYCGAPEGTESERDELGIESDPHPEVCCEAAAG